jgi:hypothetical protein
LCHNIYRHGQEVKGALCAYVGNFFFPDGQGASAAMPVSVRGQPYGRLTRQKAYHGGLSLSIPEQISCVPHLTFALILCEASLQLSRSY